MARLATFLLIILQTCAFVGSSMFSQECSAEKKIPCERLSTSAGYTYPVPQNMRDLNTKHCEHGWYFPNETFLVDSAMDGSKNKLKIVVDVTPENLTVSTCVNLQWQLNCAKYNCMINYRVADLNTNQMHKQDDNVGLPNWGITVIVTVIVAVIGTIFGFVCYCYRKSGNRWNYKVAFSRTNSMSGV